VTNNISYLSLAYGITGMLCLGLLTGCAATYRDLDETFIREPYAHQRWLSFLRDGATTASQALDSLGEPTVRLGNGSVFAYRLVLAARDQDSTAENYRDHFGLHYLWAGRNPTAAFNEGIDDHNTVREQSSESGRLWVWRHSESERTFFPLFTREAEYSLILEFDGNNMLRSHSLRLVRP
jgi:hypothetical protein